MSKFVVKTVESVKGRQKFKQLVIVSDKEDVKKLQAEIDKKEQQQHEVKLSGVLDEYESSLEDKYVSSFRGILTLMNAVANLQSLPSTKFKDVTPGKEAVKEYEFKYQDLRVFAIKIPNGQLVMLG